MSKEKLDFKQIKNALQKNKYNGLLGFCKKFPMCTVSLFGNMFLIGYALIGPPIRG
jgi:hypothetical protein